MKKILVIDPQTDSRNLFLEGLKAQGFYAISAQNGIIGVQRARQLLPDLIICEIVIPELDGYSVLTTLRQDSATAIIPFILVTSKEERTEHRKAMELGANDYLTKEELLKAIAQSAVPKAIAVQLEKQTLLQQWYIAQSQPDPESQAAQQASFANVPLLPLPSSQPPLIEVFRFIEANYHRPIALGDVAQAVGYSPAYLTNLIRRQTGRTVLRWIIERRMAAARSLLLETNQIIEQIATQVGYHHVVHFFRQFRQFHGTTPQAWRSAHRS